MLPLNRNTCSLNLNEDNTILCRFYADYTQTLFSLLEFDHKSSKKLIFHINKLLLYVVI